MKKIHFHLLFMLIHICNRTKCFLINWITRFNTVFMLKNNKQCVVMLFWWTVNEKKRISEHLHGIFAKSIIKLQGVEEAKNTLGSPCSSNCTIIARCILVIIIYSYYYTQSSLTLVRVKAHMKFSTKEFWIWCRISSFRIFTYVCPMCDIIFVSFFH